MSEDYIAQTATAGVAGPRLPRPAFGENPDVDIMRLAAASSMQRLERERDEARDECDRLRALVRQALEDAGVPDDVQANWRERAGLEGLT